MRKWPSVLLKRKEKKRRWILEGTAKSNVGRPVNHEEYHDMAGTACGNQTRPQFMSHVENLCWHCGGRPLRRDLGLQSRFDLDPSRLIQYPNTKKDNKPLLSTLLHLHESVDVHSHRLAISSDERTPTLARNFDFLQPFLGGCRLHCHWFHEFDGRRLGYQLFCSVCASLFPSNCHSVGP